MLASREEIDRALQNMASMSPLEVMLMGMHLKLNRGDLEGAVQIASVACPYTAPRLAQSEVSVRHSLSSRSDADVAAEIEALRVKVERSRLAVIPPQIEAQAEPVVFIPTSLAETGALGAGDQIEATTERLSFASVESAKEAGDTGGTGEADKEVSRST
jgi:hypothetical protein